MFDSLVSENMGFLRLVNEQNAPFGISNTTLNNIVLYIFSCYKIIHILPKYSGDCLEVLVANSAG